MNLPITLRTILRSTITALCCAVLILSGPAAFAQPGNGKGNGGQGPAPQAQNGKAPGRADTAPGEAADSKGSSQASEPANPGQARRQNPSRSAPDDAPTASSDAASSDAASSGAASSDAASSGAASSGAASSGAASSGAASSGAASSGAASSGAASSGAASSGAASSGAASSGTAQVSASFTCATVTASSSKDLSNVVLVFADGSTQRFEGLSGPSGTFAGTGEHAGRQILAVYVKSGSNHSGDGPGYGERFDSTVQCAAAGEEDPPTPALAIDEGAGDPSSVAIPPPTAPSPSDSVLGAPEPASPAISVLSDQVVAPEPSERVFVPAGEPGDVMAVPSTPVPGALAATGTGIVAQLVAGLLLTAGGICLRRRVARS